jgi:hypothetical protein
MTNDDSSPDNPYASPRPPPLPTGHDRPPPQSQAYALCPHCGADAAKGETFTWWGGLLGPKLLNHVRCQSCGRTYNGRTGGTNTLGIAVYMIVTTVFFIVAGLLAVSYLL